MKFFFPFNWIYSMKKTYFWEEVGHPASIEEIRWAERVLKYLLALVKRRKDSSFIFCVLKIVASIFCDGLSHLMKFYFIWSLPLLSEGTDEKFCQKKKCTFNLGLNERLESSMKLNFSTYIVLYHVLNTFPNWKYWRFNWEYYFYLLYCITWTSSHSTGSGLKVSRLKSTLS